MNTGTQSKGITRGYYQITRADGTVEPVVLAAVSVQHPNPLKRLFYLLRERKRKHTWQQ